MKTLFILILLLLIGLGLAWYRYDSRPGHNLRGVEEELFKSAEHLREAIQDRLEKLSLNPEDIKEELAQSGKVVRQKARELGEAMAETAADTKVTATIKAKYFADDELSGLSISVNTTRGIVTLAGTVSSHELIGKAMLLALDTQGVQEVISTLQVRQTKPAEPAE